MYSCARGTFQYTVQPGDSLWTIARRFNTTINDIIAANPGVNFNFIYIGQVICIPSNNMGVNTRQSMPDGGKCFTQSEVSLMNKIRRLWEEHSVWTRATILSLVDNGPDTELVTQRLLRNPTDFADLLRPLYGNDIASRFERLLRDHLVIAAQLVKAAKAGDSKAAEDYERQWYENADELAAFLASINPYWSESEWRDMLHEHLRLVKAEAVSRLNKNYAENIRIFDIIQTQALKMADVMSSGIIRQFPSRFQ